MFIKNLRSLRTYETGPDVNPSVHFTLFSNFSEIWKCVVVHCAKTWHLVGHSEVMTVASGVKFFALLCLMHTYTVSFQVSYGLFVQLLPLLSVLCFNLCWANELVHLSLLYCSWMSSNCAGECRYSYLEFILSMLRALFPVRIVKSVIVFRYSYAFVHCLQGENIVREIFPKKVAELNALLEVLFVFRLIVC